MLSLSKKSLDKIFHTNITEEELAQKLDDFLKCFKKKVIAFFIILFATLLFFAYFVMAFCATYVNTQGNLFKDSLVSFCLSMLYPFGICIGAVGIRKLAIEYSLKILFIISTFL